jgi:hypothetical protein
MLFSEEENCDRVSDRWRFQKNLLRKQAFVSAEPVRLSFRDICPCNLLSEVQYIYQNYRHQSPPLYIVGRRHQQTPHESIGQGRDSCSKIGFYYASMIVIAGDLTEPLAKDGRHLQRHSPRRDGMCMGWTIRQLRPG